MAQATRSVLLLLITLSVTRLASAQTGATPPTETRRFPISAGAEVAVLSDYVWHGFLLNPTASLQPNLWTRIGDVTISSWMNASRTGPNGQSITEHDLTIDLTRHVGAWTMSAGWTNYAFVDLSDGRFSNELYVGAEHESYFTPAIRVSTDVQAGSGTYVSVGASHEYLLWKEHASISPSASVGYNHRQWIDASTFSDGTVGLVLDIPLARGRLQLSPSVTYSVSLNPSLFQNHFFAGVCVSVH